MTKNYLELFWQFVKNDFKIRYKNSYLGLLWVILKPLAMFSISYVVWSNIFGTDPNFKKSLLLGLIIMMFFAELLMMGLSSLMNKAYIILKINFKREVAIFSTTFIAVIDFIINMIVYFILTSSFKNLPSLEGLGIFLLAILTLYLLSVSVTFFIALWFIKLRDILNLVELAIQLLYWATPIYYPISIIPDKYKAYIMYNPLTIIVDASRNGLILYKDIFNYDLTNIYNLFYISLLLFILGFIYFRKKVVKVAEYF